jgi:phage tail protein X
MRVQITRENMTFDLIVWQAFGRQDSGVIEQALALNPGIAALGAFLPVGTTIELPEPQAPKPTLLETVTLWS